MGNLSCLHLLCVFACVLSVKSFLMPDKSKTGVSLRSNYVIKYTIGAKDGLCSSDFRFASVRFATKLKVGVLVQLVDEGRRSYITLRISNMGGVMFDSDIGNHRFIRVTNRDVTDGREHMATVNITDNGHYAVLQVDDEIHSTAFNPPFQTDTATLKYLYIGNNDTKATFNGFQGCIYSVDVNSGLFSLEQAFQEPPSPNVQLYPKDRLKLDVCELKPIPFTIKPSTSYDERTSPRHGH